MRYQKLLQQTAQRPLLMGIVNLHPQSFFTVGRVTETDAAVDYALSLIEAGADLIDVGAEPTNPTLAVTDSVRCQEELNRLVPFVRRLRAVAPNVCLSVDTSQPLVMRAVVEAGADFINDVRALRVPGALETLAALQVPVCLMHMFYPCGKKANEALQSVEDICTFVKDFLLERVALCLDAGILPENLILDPGLGGGIFVGKRPEQDLQLLQSLSDFVQLGYPVLIGPSYKSFMRHLLGLEIDEQSEATLVAGLYAADAGVTILRVHEVLKMKRALAMRQLVTV